MKRAILIFALASSLAGCSYFDYFVLKSHPSEQDNYATLVGQSKMLSEHCGKDYKIVGQGLQVLRQEAEIASTLTAAVSTDEIKEASTILNKMVGEMHTMYAKAGGKPPSAVYCRMKLKNIQDVSQKLLNITARIGG